MLVAFRSSLLRSVAVLGVVLALLAFSGVRPAHGVTTIVVDSTADSATVNGNCTLRDAITAANENSDVDHCFGSGGGVDDVINFNIGLGTPEIDIGATALPTITERVKIEGNSGGADKVLVHGPGGSPVSGANGLTVDVPAAGTEIDDMVVNRFQGDGVLVLADEVRLLGDYIGTDPTGQFAFSNQGFGVDMHGNGDHVGTSDNASCPYACSLIAGNHMANVVFDDSASGGSVEGSYIGTSATGESVMPGFAVDGVIDNGQNDTIGGTDGTTPDGSYCSGDCNIIVGDPQGVLVTSVAVNSVVEGNYIGLDGAGTFGLNDTTDARWGVWTVANGTRIGGTIAAARNFIGGATQANVYVGGGQNAVVEGNYIGLQADGSATIGEHATYGVNVFQSLGTEIGGTSEGTPNVIGGATFAGVDIYQSTGVKVQGNYIGTAPDGVTHLSNANNGVVVEQGSSNSLIGGTTEGSGNKIAFNGGDGVRLDNTAPLVHDNTIRRNSIYSNDGAGVALIAGANDGILPPTITGDNPLTGTACQNCTIEIFSDQGDEGKTYEGVTAADAGGDWTLSSSVAGPNITATATDTSGNTSAFSEPFAISTPTPTPSPSPTATPSGSHIQGDVNCDGVIDDTDFEFLLEYAAGLNDGMTSGCYTLGGQGIGPYVWGDLNCDGFVNAVDALYLLAYRAGIVLTPVNHPCTPIGQTFTGSPPD